MRIFALLHAHGSDPLVTGPLTLLLMLLLLRLLGRAGSAQQGLQCYLGGILFSVVNVLPIVPEASVDGLAASNGDGRGPGCAAPSTIGDNVEDRRVKVATLAVVCWTRLVEYGTKKWPKMTFIDMICKGGCRKLCWLELCKNRSSYLVACPARVRSGGRWQK